MKEPSPTATAPQHTSHNLTEQSEKKRNLVTLHDQNGEPLLFDQALKILAEFLMILPAQSLAQTLAEIGNILHEESWDDADRILREKYCSLDVCRSIFPSNDANNTHVLFNRNAIWIVNTLLTFNIEIKSRDHLNFRIFSIQNKIHKPITSLFHLNNPLPITEIFLLANQLIIHLEREMPEFKDGQLAGTPLYYSKHRVREDALTAIGKAKNLYNTEYFNKTLLTSLGVSVSQLSEYLFLLFSLVKAHKPAKIESDFSFRKIKQDIDKKNAAKLLDLLSIDVRGTDATLSQISKILREDFIQDFRCRGKPFLKINKRYLCVRHDLLISTLGNFPYHYLLNSLPEEKKTELFKEFGRAFEKGYMPDISKAILGSILGKYTYTKKPYRGGNPGDLYLSITDQSKFIGEIKSSRENDSVKLGSKQEIVDKFIHLKGSKEKGIMQAINDAVKLRNDLFSGEIFTGIIFYSFPQTTEFDELVRKEIEDTEKYQNYLKNGKNFPSIWLNVFNYELILSAIQQGASLHDLLKRIAGSSPSKTGYEIVSFMKELNLEISISRLYHKEIEFLKNRCKEMLFSDEEYTHQEPFR
jgi:hypothetical protein